MFHTLTCPILLLGRPHPTPAHVDREGHNSLVDQDLIGVCHIHTYVHRKIHRHINSRAHTRNTVNSPDKIAFSDSFRHQRVGCIGWWFACIMHVCAGGSDQMLYQHIPVLTPDITTFCSSLPPSFLDIVVRLVMFRCFDVVWCSIQKLTSRDLSKVGCMFSRKRVRPVDFSTLTLQSWEVYLRKIWRFASVTQYSEK